MWGLVGYTPIYIVMSATVVIILVLCRQPDCESLCMGITVIHKRCYVTADFLCGLLALTVFLPYLRKVPLVLGVGLTVLGMHFLLIRAQVQLGRDKSDYCGYLIWLSGGVCQCCSVMGASTG